MADSEYVWLNSMSQQFLDKDYLEPGQTVDERVNIIAKAAGKILKDPEFAPKFVSYMKKGWFSLSTPIWSNFGAKRGFPISCFGSHVEDTTKGIFSSLTEVGMMTKYGGGTSGYFGDLRPRGAKISSGGESSGPVHFMQLFDKMMDVVSQGSVRRGSFAAYLPVEHPDIMEFLAIRSEGNPIQGLNYGVCISDNFMTEMKAGNKEYRKIQAKIIESKTNTGYPYLFFTGNANKGAPDVYKDLGMVITHSNLCTEIMEPDSKDESFTCDLMSMNIAKFGEWRGTDAVRVAIQLLDAVNTEFIEKAKHIEELAKAVRFATRHRAVGLGWLGWHTYLQENMIPFEGMEAHLKNVEIAKHIQTEALESSKELAVRFGEPELLKGYGRRNTVLTAIAPTKSSAFILGQVSEGIEPHRSNYYIKDLAKGKFTIKNPQLEKLLISKERNTDEVWESILKNRGSVQNLEFLSDHEKAVFMTFSEISPKAIITQAAARQNFIDQGQSINLMIHPATPVKDINALYIMAWELGIKSLYYQISVNAAQELTRNIMDCVSCEA